MSLTRVIVFDSSRVRRMDPERKTPHRVNITDLLLPLDDTSGIPLYRQVYEGLRNAIIEERLPPGARIPSTRRLAEYLAVSRTTVLVAFEQLAAEGFLVGAVGSGSRVSDRLPPAPPLSEAVDNPPEGGMGYHHHNEALLDDRIELERPEILVYERMPNGAYRLNGVEYIVPFSARTMDAAPPTVMGQRLKPASSLGLWYGEAGLPIVV